MFSALLSIMSFSDRNLVPAYDVDSSAQEADSDWAEDMMLEEDDSGGEDSVRTTEHNLHISHPPKK